jgi:hypothetical protein
MNMNFHPSDVHVATTARHTRRATASGRSGRPALVRYFVWSVLVLGVLYLIAHASIAVLLGVTAAIVALILFATVICIYALNNTRI